MAKKEEFVPTELVKRLYGEGKGETEVIMQLRSQGFTPVQIDRAMKAVPKPKFVPPAAHVGPVKEEAYRGPLPREAIRPIARAEAPEQRPFAPLEGTEVGETPEKITIPENLKPIEIAAPAGPAPKREKGGARPAEERMPAPIAAPAGAPRISLEELVEQIVSEQGKKFYAEMGKLEAAHNDNVKKMADVSAKLDMITVTLRALEKSVADKSAFSADSVKGMSVKVEALETAFKELSHFMKKK